MKTYWPKLLIQSQWVSSLPGDVQAEIAGSLKLKSVAEGAEIIRQGDPFSGIACVIDGEMQVIGTARNGDELLIGILRAGDWTGFLAALDKGRYAFSVRATHGSQVAILSASATKRIFERDLERFKLLLQPELTASRNTYSYFIEISYRPPMQRLAERMIGLGRWPYSTKPHGPVFLRALSQSDLANATRLSRQTINSCLQAMAAAGIVRIGYRSVEVIDVDKLNEVASGDIVLD